jgi:hypothetical protein
MRKTELLFRGRNTTEYHSGCDGHAWEMLQSQTVPPVKFHTVGA